MRSILILAAGIWLGKQIHAVLSGNRTIARELTLRKRLRQFLQEHFPALSDREVQQTITNILK